jgi:2-dehydro-3-deoxyphosphogluconate aldolase / (4S)-4-hydroxy-2-oxoglutarate aldolase
MCEVLEKIGFAGIIPVAVIEDIADAIPLANAVLEGGLEIIEVTFRTTAAKEAMTRIARAHPKMLLGAGTVLSVEQAQSAIDAGAKFIVSPGLNRDVVEFCLSQEITVTPGVVTPTEIEAAMALGLDVVKFFPAEASGGVGYLKAVSAPYGEMQFIPTGGINESNVISYLECPCVLACGGSWMVKGELLKEKRFDEVRRLTESCCKLIEGVERTDP